jgi:hypothetical protein
LSPVVVEGAASAGDLRQLNMTNHVMHLRENADAAIDIA